MPYYAQINAERIVTAVTQTAGLIDQPDMIEVLSLDAELTGCWYDAEASTPQAPIFRIAQLPVANVVPQTISRAQGKAVLIQMGLWPSVLTFVAAIPDTTERALAEVALHDTTTWQRTSPFLNAAAAALGLSGAQMDDLFTAAHAIAL